MTELLADDLEHILQHTLPMLEELTGEEIFITGGTGFFGLWLLESIRWANLRHKLDIRAKILTRQKERIQAKAPHLYSDPAFRFLTGDIQDFEFPDSAHKYVIHGATTNARETFNNHDALEKYRTVAEGTRHLLDFAAFCGAAKLLYISSGACYGRQPPDLSHIDENYSCAPSPADPNAALGIGKRSAEFYCHYYASRHGIEIKIARCFSFLGPHLPLDIHYAIGNFVSNGIAGKNIEVTGDGTPQRSWLYIADLVIWLWTILLKGRNLEAYNVGSEHSMSVRTAAEKIARHFGVAVRIRQQASGNQPVNRYVPSVAKARSELCLQEWVGFEEGIDRMARHIRAAPALYSD